nr:uncharacterized protein LOC127491968 [Oryctolagus cuniculus]
MGNGEEWPEEVSGRTRAPCPAHSVLCPTSAGGTPSTSPLGFHPELDRAIAALASALSHACWPYLGAGRKASNQLAEQTLSTCQPDMLLMAQPPPSDQLISPQQDTGPMWHPQGGVKGEAAQSPGHEEWICWTWPDHGALPELQRKIQQVEDTMDELNEEFLQLSAQALELQKEETEPDQLLSEGDTFVMAPGISPRVWQESRLNPAETGSPGREELRTQVLQSEQALALEVRRIHLAQKIEDLEWELSLLLQVAADGSTNLGSPGSPESLRTQQWPPVGRAFSTKDMTRFPW